MKLNTLYLIILFTSFSSVAQQKNREITIPSQQPFLVGEITIDGLSSNTYKDWFIPNVKSYKVNMTKINAIKNVLSTYKILVFMGTWCGDSKREIPKFIKVLQAANFPMDNLKLVAVDKRKTMYKKSPQGEEWALNILRVPTFIFYKNGKEMNRIIESPIVSMEEDITAIVLQKKYTPNYASSLHFD